MKHLLILSYCAPYERVLRSEGNRSDVSLTQLGNKPKGTAAWRMSASRGLFFILGHWVDFERAALSDQRPGRKAPGTIQVRRTQRWLHAMSRNLTHWPKRRANTRTWEQGITQRTDELQGGRQEPCFQKSSNSYINYKNNCLRHACHKRSFSKQDRANPDDCLSRLDERSAIGVLREKPGQQM